MKQGSGTGAKPAPKLIHDYHLRDPLAKYAHKLKGRKLESGEQIPMQYLGGRSQEQAIADYPRFCERLGDPEIAKTVMAEYLEGHPGMSN
jgi:hypothetical protein